MESHVFALIIGIDQYKSGDIWNLESCVDDAKKIRRWLVSDLGVPKSQISMLLGEQASKQNIETQLVQHFLNNERLQKGDAIFIYFAGHGSSLRSPADWLCEKDVETSVEVLCSYDHDTRGPNGRVAGISARAMHAFIRELSVTKSNNVTVVLDVCFSPPPPQSRDRRYIRWTPTTKALPEDLYSGFLPCPRRRKTNESFYNRNPTHTAIVACAQGSTAAETKSGGRFTSAFLETVQSAPLHSTSFGALMDNINHRMGEAQRLHYTRHNADRLFNAIPFVEDLRYVPVRYQKEKGVRIELGSLHGIVRGGEFSLHVHNYIGSRNPAIANVVVLDVHPTWCTGRSKSSLLPKHCWARMPHDDEHRLLSAIWKRACFTLLHIAGIPYKTSPDVRQPPSRSSSFDSKCEVFKSEYAPGTPPVSAEILDATSVLYPKSR